MRHLHLWHAIRIGLAVVLVGLAACAEQPQPEPGAGLLTDFASGIDSSFGVEAFQLTDPTLKISSPADKVSKTVTAGGKASFDLVFATTFFTPGKINCYVDGVFDGATATDNYTTTALGKGYHTVGCVLVDTSGTEYTVASARAVIHVAVTTSCNLIEDCSDGNVCTQDACIGNVCTWASAAVCCASSFDCAAGELCTNPNTAQSKCSACATNKDCDDGSPCTTDTCDLSGFNGVCKHVKTDPECCVKSDSECNDGKGCTVDSCNVSTGKCSHVQPPGSCCSNSECVTDDVCLVGVCEAYECRYGKDAFKPDCCSAGTNPTCNDNYYCTVDKCELSQPGGWTKCSHKWDESKVNCCDPVSGNTNECQDGNSCTYDVCASDATCYNIPIGECCSKDLDCADNQPCTNDKCDIKAGQTTGQCLHDKIPECCVSTIDCGDSKYCTIDSCVKNANEISGTCAYSKVQNCCDTKAECDDGKTCTDDVCVNYTCIHGPDAFKPNCCDANADCNDGNACTIDSCDLSTKLCKFVDNGDPTCCTGASDCDDGKCTTADFCDTTNKCTHKDIAGSCTDKSQCDDGNSCTIDACSVTNGCGSCTHAPDPSCCKYDTACNDNKPCTLDRCVNSKCEHSPIASCCIDDKDALTACDDNNACTIEYCVNNQCRHTAPKGGCCVKNADCNDGIDCTTDTCADIANGTGTCSNVAAVGCTACTTANQAVACNDNNACTVDTCVSNSCVHTNKTGCCIDKFDCDDGKPCTLDTCITSMQYCVHQEESGGLKPCCTPETELTECGNLTTACATGKCLDQPDGSRQCVAVAKAACTYDLNYCQDFSTSTNLAILGWNPVDLTGTAKTNWSVATNGGLGPDQYARFYWSPTKVNYDTCLTSPVFQAAGSNSLSIQFDREYVKNTGLAGIRVLGSLDGENADWTKAVLIDQVAPNANFGPETVDIVLPPELSGSNGLRLAVCISGSTTYDISRFGIDNFCVAKGKAPTFTSCPANRTMLAGKSLSVPVKAKDPDLNNIVTFSLVSAPSFVSISSALYSWLDSSWNANVTMTPQLSDVGDHEITIKVSDGHLYKLCSFTVTVTFEGGVLVWKPSEVPVDAGTPLVDAIKALGKQVQMVDDIALYSDLTKFDAVFVLLGVFPNNHALKESEINSLKLFLSQGGRVYMEGGDTWAFDPPTSLHAFFKVDGLLDSASNGVTGPLKGYSTYTDTTANPIKHYQWAYSQSDVFNNINDQIAGKNVAKTANILRNEGFEKFWVQVAHDDTSAKYRTIASSILFAGIKADTDNAQELLKQIFKFFDNGLAACTSATQCDDGNNCTTDSCDLGLCYHTNTCLCAAQSEVKCGDKLTKLTSNGGGSTDVVNSYACSSGNTFLGKEMAYAFLSATSAPVTIKLTNVNSAKARLFVLKATTKGCDPDGCLAFDPVASGAATVSFPAQGNVQYYVVVDAEGDSDAATYDLEISCEAGEICDDGKDNNGNGLADCDDWASCCGFPSCGELCDGIDNDCNGEVDEKCDDDGDGYCDLTVGIKKTALCKKSKLPTDGSTINGDDCADGDTSVNPGAQEICGNGKDDDCDGVQDEPGASGCINFYADLDGDGYGSGTAKCLCQAEGAYKAKVGGDCDDAAASVNPGAQEDCSTSIDDDCDSDTNDLNALGCINYYVDKDGDTYGDKNSPFKCICTSTGSFTAGKSGDCDDANASLNPGKTEICNNLDDNCNTVVDEGCDDDKDGYCDNNLTYDTTAEPLSICPKGAGDSDDTDKAINPEGKEICDGKDNDSNGLIDEGCDDDKDGYCDADMVTVGKPAVCPSGGGDCDDTASVKNPGVAEDCATAYDDNCNGSTNDIGAKGCTPFFYDADGDKFGISTNQCLCIAAPPYKALNPGDCDDTNSAINPDALEICDDKDNDCDKVVDDGCDDDGDGYCETGMKIVGSPAICPSGTGDCNDTSAGVNPSKAEICGNSTDENCNGTTNEENATGCLKYYADADGDGFGAGTPKCFCEATSIFKTTLANDCADDNKDISPAAEEICDGKDNDCNGVADNGCDADGDGNCAAGKIVTTGASCLKGGGDCDDNNPNIYKGKTAEVCDGKDDDCNGKTDNGCDDDKDGYCDSGLTIASPPPAICSKGSGDCDDFNFDVNPGAPEVCNNSIDDNCNNSQNDENAAGCANFYFDGDKDGAGLSLKKCLCTGTGSFVATKAGDCADSDPYVYPGVTEVCDNKDNNCDGTIDEENATNCSLFYNDADKDGFGIDLTKCYCTATGTFTAIKKGDCNDAVKAVSPGATEICNDVDDNCDGQVDEGCNADGDEYCAANKTVVGFPTVCSKGGGDCNDADPNVSTAGVEICNNSDDNCNGTVDEGCDDDGDTFCDANMKLVGTSSKCSGGGGDCDDTKAAINPGAKEICGNTVDENCSGGYNDVNAQGCTTFYEDADGDAFGKIGGNSACLCIKTGNLTATKLGDCDDSNELVNGGAAELCDGIDNNCNSQVDEGCDVDADGYCDSNKITIGSPPVCPKGGGDCNDQVKAINPGAAEICGNTVDENCDGSLNSSAASNCTDYYYDGDNDGFGVNVKQCLCTPENGFTATKAGDCDDTSAIINPNAVEICGNGKDDNCNGDANEAGAQGCKNYYVDGDKDGYGAGTPKCICTAEGTYITATTGDCNDADNTIRPNGTEICDGKDNNCNGQTDEGCDDDGDGHCDATMQITATATCLKSTPKCDGIISNGICYQAFPTLTAWPPAQNACSALGGSLVSISTPNENVTVRDAINKGCGSTATAWIGLNDYMAEGTWAWVNAVGLVYLNWASGQPQNNLTLNSVRMLADGSWEAYNSSTSLCYVCRLGKVSVGGGDDCNDNDKLINPSATEVCDDKDNNCDGVKDDTCDNDKDGYCGINKTVIGTPQICLKGKNDCDDSNNTVNPGKTEICDGADNDCDGTTDEGCDDDNDDYCDSAMAISGTPPTCSKGGNDCNDTNDKINPGATEVCGDSLDNNCVGGADEICNDEDGDGYCKGVQAPSDGCPKGGGDCDDGNKLINPAAAEDCGTGADDNCNGLTNEKDALKCVDFYVDEDKDGYGALESISEVDNLKNCTSCGTGKDGDYVASTNTTLAGGNYEYKSFTINAGVTVTVTGGAPLVLKVQGKVSILGKLNLSGGDAADSTPSSNGCVQSACSVAGTAVAGGGVGGYGCYSGAGTLDGTAGGGTGGGGGATYCGGYGAGGGGGSYGTQGGSGIPGASGCNVGSAGTTYSGIQAGTLMGGSGGGAGSYGTAYNAGGAGGGGGGGAIRIDASEILVPGQILANGGRGGHQRSNCDGGAGGGGSGGAIWLRGNKIDLSGGTVSAKGGAGGDAFQPESSDGGDGGAGGDGRVRIDAVTFAGTTSPVPYFGDGSAKVFKSCLCMQDDTFSATISGDCADDNSNVSPAATEICDGLDNSCSGKIDPGCDDDLDGFCAAGKTIADPKACPKTGTIAGPNCTENSPAFIGSVVNMNTYSHGGGYHHYRKEFWYPNWNGPIIYRYNSSYQYQGNFNGNQYNIMGLEGDFAVDAWFSANWGESTVTRHNGMSGGAIWTRSVGTTSGGVAVDTNYVYGFPNGSPTVYVLDKSNGNVVKTFSLSPYLGSSNYGGTFIHKDHIWLPNPDNLSYFKYALNGAYTGESFKVATQAYNGAYDGTKVCISPNSSSVYCYDMGKVTCSVGDDCNDKNKDVNPEATEVCDDTDNNCNSAVDEGCDDDADGFCDDAAPLPFGNCCSAHPGTGCSVTTIQSCLCGKPGYDYCCTVGWDKNCAAAAKTQGCSTCKFPAICPAGGGDCDDKSNLISPAGKESCGTPEDDDCDGTLNTINADGCTKYYQDNDQDGFGTASFQCTCTAEGSFSASVAGDCNDNDPKIFSGYAVELCDALDNNCNGVTDELCDADGDGYCDAGKVVIKNTACPKSPGSDATCGDALTSTAQFVPRTLGINPRSYGGGYHAKRGEYWFPEYNSGDTVMYRFEQNAPFKEIGNFKTGLPYIRQVVGDPGSDDWYAATYQGIANGLYRMAGMTNVKKWQSANLTSYLSGVVENAGLIYTMRYNDGKVWAVNASDGARRADKEFTLNTYTGSTFGIGIVDGKFYRSSDSQWIYRYDLGTGSFDGTRLRSLRPAYAVAVNATELCSSDGSAVPECVTLPKASETFGSVHSTANPRSHGAGYHHFRKEYWYPQWANPTIYRYDQKLRYVGEYNSGQSEIMQIWGDKAEDAWYSANWGQGTIRRRNGLDQTVVWSVGIGAYASGVAVGGNNVYAMQATSSTVWELNKANGATLRTFNMSNGWYAGGWMYGGLVVEGSKIWRAADNRWFERHNISNGAWDGTRIYLDTNPYSSTWDGSRYCYSPNNNYQYCMGLPNDDTRWDQNSNSNNGSGGGSVKRTFALQADSYGIAWNPKTQEFWSPIWASNTVRRMNAAGTHLGNMTIGASENMDLAIDTDGSYATANWGQNVCRRFNAAHGQLWSYNVGTTAGGVAMDDDYAYCMRYNNSTVWAIDKSTGAGKYTFGLENMTVYIYGGLDIVGDSLIVGTTNQYIRTFDKRTGRARGVSFRPPVPVYTSFWKENEYCVSSNSGGPQTFYCYDMRDTQGRAILYRSDIRNNANSHGAGYHPNYKEYWNPSWSGDTIYRFDQNKSYVSSFRNGRGNIMHLAGDTASKMWFAAEWGYNTIGAYDGEKYGPVWLTNIGSTAAAVAVDGNFVYGIWANGGPISKMNKSNGAMVSQINMTGGSYLGSTTYGPIAVVDNLLYRGDTNGYVERYDLASGKADGTLLTWDRAAHTGSYDPVDREFCAYHNSYPGEAYCMTLPTGGGSGAKRDLGVDPKSNGGGYHQKYDEFWYPEWNSADATTVYRYDVNGAPKGTFNSGLRYVSQIIGDANGTEYYASVYNASSTYARVHRMAALSNTKVWTAPYVTTYLGGVGIDKNFVYTMRVNSDNRVYVFDRTTGNRRTDKEVLLGNWNGNTTWGLAVQDTKLYRTSSDGWIYRYDLADGAHDGIKIPVAFGPESLAYTGKELCVGRSAAGALVHCYEVESSSTSYAAKQVTQPTQGEGGGFHHYRNEYWYPLWSAGDTQVYRYSKQRNLVGVFTAKQRYMRQVWGDTNADAWYSANWSDANITRRRGLTSDVDWTYNIGSNPGGVAGDGVALYAMLYNQPTVHQINKKTGTLIKSFNLTGYYASTLYGGLAVAQGKLFRGDTGGWVYRYDLATGAHDNIRITMPIGIYSATFDGADYCVGTSSTSSTAAYCVQLVSTSCAKGTDCDDNLATVNPGITEICDDVDNNCDNTADDGCDADGDDYCDLTKVIIGTPKVCPNGGGDCNDNSAVENPATAELCDGKDNNCDKVVDEPGAQGCVNYFIDADQDGYGVTTAAKCLCKADGVFSATNSGDCDDKCADCAPGKPEICDGKSNDCNSLPMKGSSYTRQPTMSAYSNTHGAGYHPNLNQYWYTAWSSQTIYRYNTNFGYLGAFNSGIDQMMGLAGDTTTSDFYSANWGYATITRRKYNSTTTVWTRSIGSAYASAVAADDNYVYAMKDYSEPNKVYVLDKATGQDVAARPHFNLSGGGYFSTSDGAQFVYGGLSVQNGKLYRTTRNRYTYRYDLGTGVHDGVLLYTVPQSSYVDTSVMSANEICVSSYGYNYTRCYTLPSANANLTPKVVTMETYSHGGGYHRYRQEYWYPQWNNGNIYRYDSLRKPLSTISAGQGNIMDLQGDATIDRYYTANWDYNTFSARNGTSTSLLWNRGIGSYAAGVAAEGNDVYAMLHSSQTVWVLDRNNGNITRTFNLATGTGEWTGGTMYGALAVQNGVLYRPDGSGRWIYGYNVSDGSHEGTKINTAVYIYNGSFDGKEICVSANNNQNYCYNIGGGIYTIDVDCDKDGDGYCDDNKVTVGKPASCPKGAGDCDDSSSTSNPQAIEICNGLDENCNGVKDDGASAECMTNKNAEASCIAGTCKITKCNTGFSDLNGLGADGCECNSFDGFEPNNTCGQATPLAQVNDNGSVVSVKARVIDMTDSDWYRIYAYDAPDSGTAVCDTFNVRARFLANPNNALRFEVFRGTCPPNKFKKEQHNPSVVVDNAVCCGQVDFNWFTSFKGYLANGFSSSYSEFGECNCTTSSSTFYTGTGYNYGPANNPYGTGGGGPYGRYNGSSGVTDRNTASQSWGYDYTRCRDDSAYFYIRVYREGNMTTCSDYELEVSNGAYGNNGARGYVATPP